MIIPRNIYLFWHTKILPPKMKENVDFLEKNNPEFKIILYDLPESEKLIAEHFPPKVLDAFIKLVPLSYKADLFRYCILYLKGGIYLDIKFKQINDFKFINLCEKEWFVEDWNSQTQFKVTTGLLVCKKNNQMMEEAINLIVENVKTRNYGLNCLDPTGPLLLGRIFHKYYPNYHFEIKNTFDQLELNNQLILIYYPNYRTEQRTYSSLPHYSQLYNAKQIYLDDLIKIKLTEDNNIYIIYILLLLIFILAILL